MKKVNESGGSTAIRGNPSLADTDAQKEIQMRMRMSIHHPLFQRGHPLITPTVAKFFTRVCQIVMLTQEGVYFSGTSGIGKSYAVSTIPALLRREFPHMEVYIHNCLNKQTPSIRGFFKHFLDSLHHSILTGETYDLRRRVAHRIIDVGRQSGYNLVVMMIDEAQQMNLDDFCFLKDVANDVRLENVQLLTVLVAQDPDFVKVINMLREKERLDLISRFAMTALPFEAELTLKNLEGILLKVDEIRCTDLGGCYGTEYFLPIAFGHGYRLAKEAARLETCIRKISPVKKRATVLPARQLFQAIRNFLMSAMPFDAPVPDIDESLWLTALRNASVEDGIGLSNRTRRSSK
jgi:hypothetical protein